MAGGLRRAWGWLEADPGRALALTLLLTVALRAPFLGRPFETDEGGYLMVADQWHGGGTSLYGDQWVDRPPLLLVIFKLAVLCGGSAIVVHLFAVGFNLLLVVAAWWCGRIINGSRGAVVSAVVAAVLGANLTLSGMALTGELIAASFVLAACALLLQAKYRSESARTGLPLVVGAGVLAAMAFLVKQNFIDAALFGMVLLAIKPRRTWRLLVGYLVGLTIPLLLTGLWAAGDEGPGIARLWHALYRFRRRVFDIVQDTSTASAAVRLETLVGLFLVTGMVVLSWQLVVACRRVEGWRRLRVAVFVMWLYAILSILGGGSWWGHYLIELVPVLAMGAALATRQRVSVARVHVAPTLAAALSVLAALVGLTMAAFDWAPGYDDVAISAYLKDASAPRDTVVLAYGAPNIIWQSGLTTPYRYSWALPVRARDPHLNVMVTTLTGSNAPTWLVEIGTFSWGGLDTHAFQRVRATDYHRVATVCGHAIYLHDGLQRRLPPVPACSPR